MATVACRVRSNFPRAKRDAGLWKSAAALITQIGPHRTQGETAPAADVKRFQKSL